MEDARLFELFFVIADSESTIVFRVDSKSYPMTLFKIVNPCHVSQRPFGKAPILVERFN
jgi:hypothetical protein